MQKLILRTARYPRAMFIAITFLFAVFHSMLCN
jgi:hypothetical protein